MEYYFLLLLSGLLFSSQIVFTKLFEKKIGSGVSVSLCFIFLSCVFSIVPTLILSGFKIDFTTYSFVLAVLLSVDNIFIIILGIKACAIGPISIYTLFFMLGGMTIPFIVGAIWLNEVIKFTHIIAFIILFGALCLPVFFFFFKTKNGDGFYRLIFICSILFVLNGANSMISKIHQINENAVDFYSFFFLQSLITGVMAAICLLFYGKDRIHITTFLNKYNLLSAFGYSVVHTLATLILLFCAGAVNASFEYPLITGGCIAFAPILAFVFFKEKMRVNIALSVIMSAFAMILFVF